MTDYRVPAVVNAVRVLHELAQGDDAGQTAAELCRATGASKSSMHNLLGTLADEGLVARDSRTLAYRLGPTLITLGAAASGQTRLLDIATEELSRLAAEKDLSFAIGQPVSPYEVVIIDRFYPRDDVHVGVRLGATYGLYEGAIGKCLLAALDDAEVRNILHKRKVPAYTERTLTDPEQILAEVGQVRERGWAAARGELNENNVVAATVADRAGTPALFLLALGFAERFDDPVIEATGALLVGTAGRIRTAAGLGG
ncbi:MAG: IclR family transcriptional regulator [Actinobacteria bacterium]|nr:IclR family transcriptional regulator [Actinomycetota bacterium]